MDFNNFTLAVDGDGIALLTWDMPDRSMNVFTEEVMDEIEAALDSLVADDAVKGIVFASGKAGSFTGGADLKMLGRMLGDYRKLEASDPHAAMTQLFDRCGRMGALWRRIETCGKPVVTAIDGTCMGGGFELALACHGRVATPRAKMGLPEVKVGIFPGAGGTQRIARMLDAQAALQFLLKGEAIGADKALAMKLIDKVAAPEELVETAKAMLKAGIPAVKSWDQKGYKLPSGPVYSAAGAQLWPAVSSLYRKETQDNYPGARAIVKCVYEGLLLPIDLGLKVEQRYFASVLRSTEAAMMIRSLFVSMQELGKGARRPQGIANRQPKRIAVIGAGFMGAGIAYVSAMAGIEVLLVDRDMAAAEKGKAHSASLMADHVKKGRAKEADAEALLSRITPADGYDGLADVDLVVEAVFEDRKVKADVIAAAAAAMKPGAIFASNTSTLPITGLAESFPEATRFIGIHFFSPVDRMMLVEVILGEKTGDEALATALDFVRAIRKTPIVVNDTRGFFANRCVLRYMSEAYDMVVEGVPPAMIENAARMAGMPVGPLALNDEVAIDLSRRIMQATMADLGEAAVDKRHFDLVNRLVDAGRLGRKAGKGFYDYPAKPAKKHLWPGLKELYPQQNAEDVDVKELQQRFLVTMALEAARTMAEGVVTDPREADVGSILGFGYAPYTGGALSYIDGMGVKAFVALCEALEKRHGERFAPIPLLHEMASAGQTFYGRFRPARQAEAA